MRVDEFDYDLPEELIAQKPAYKRDKSRLMVVDRKKGDLEDRVFEDIVEYLSAGDLLVLNNSKVIPARLFGNKKRSGIEIEVLLLNEIDDMTWEVLVRPGRRVKKGVEIEFAGGRMTGRAVEYTDFGGRVMEFSSDEEFDILLQELGNLPLPPYIKNNLDQPERYQTVFAEKKGSAAAPTAGLHFTPGLLADLEKRGVKIAVITLHIGLGTFRPVKTDTIEEHKMHSEYYELSRETADLINLTLEKGKRVIAVGTTVTRTLEGAAKEKGKIVPAKGWTDIFIYPGYKFKVIKGLITNFHLPKSTLLMLVSAFAGKEKIMKAYDNAINKNYRFYSLGDAMFIR